jgi:hypothetical protein
MTKGKQDSNWREKVLEWKASNQSASSWCFENQIPTTTFYGWKSRLEKLSNNF